jgi:hypothetical protein
MTAPTVFSASFQTVRVAVALGEALGLGVGTPGKGIVFGNAAVVPNPQHLADMKGGTTQAILGIGFPGNAKTKGARPFRHQQAFRIRLDLSRSDWIFPDPIGSFQIRLDLSGSDWIFPDPIGSFQIRLDLSRSGWIFSDPVGSFQIRLDLSGSDWISYFWRPDNATIGF